MILIVVLSALGVSMIINSGEGDSVIKKNEPEKKESVLAKQGQSVILANVSVEGDGHFNEVLTDDPVEQSVTLSESDEYKKQFEELRAVEQKGLLLSRASNDNGAIFFGAVSDELNQARIAQVTVDSQDDYSYPSETWEEVQERDELTRNFNQSNVVRKDYSTPKVDEQSFLKSASNAISTQ